MLLMHFAYCFHIIIFMTIKKRMFIHKLYEHQKIYIFSAVEISITIAYFQFLHILCANFKFTKFTNNSIIAEIASNLMFYTNSIFPLPLHKWHMIYQLTKNTAELCWAECIIYFSIWFLLPIEIIFPSSIILSKAIINSEAEQK